MSRSKAKKQSREDELKLEWERNIAAQKQAVEDLEKQKFDNLNDVIEAMLEPNGEALVLQRLKNTLAHRAAIDREALIAEGVRRIEAELLIQRRDLAHRVGLISGFLFADEKKFKEDFDQKTVDNEKRLHARYAWALKDAQSPECADAEASIEVFRGRRAREYKSAQKAFVSGKKLWKKASQEVRAAAERGDWQNVIELFERDRRKTHPRRFSLGPDLDPVCREVAARLPMPATSLTSGSKVLKKAYEERRATGNFLYDNHGRPRPFYDCLHEALRPGDLHIEVLNKSVFDPGSRARLEKGRQTKVANSRYWRHRIDEGATRLVDQSEHSSRPKTRSLGKP